MRQDETERRAVLIGQVWTPAESTVRRHPTSARVRECNDCPRGYAYSSSVSLTRTRNCQSAFFRANLSVRCIFESMKGPLILNLTLLAAVGGESLDLQRETTSVKSPYVCGLPFPGMDPHTETREDSQRDAFFATLGGSTATNRSEFPDAAPVQWYGGQFNVTG